MTGMRNYGPRNSLNAEKSNNAHYRGSRNRTLLIGEEKKKIKETLLKQQKGMGGNPTFVYYQSQARNTKFFFSYKKGSHLFAL